jgi:hypothetical protein
MVAADGSAVICARQESPKCIGEKGAGWLHRLREDGAEYRRGPRVRRITLPNSTPDLSELAEQHRQAVTPAALERFAMQLGVSADSLHRLRVGWDSQAWTFPMSDPSGRTIGIRRRFPNGSKLAVKGGCEGLFIPKVFDARSGAQNRTPKKRGYAVSPLFISEGVTDCAALITLGFEAVGRPSCTGGTRFCCELARGRDAVILADGDEPGQRGAAALASTLRIYCPSVRIITPPAGVKDARAWKQAGATTDDILAVIASAKLLTLTIQSKRAQRRAKVSA